jgi:hypothetical protein
MKHMLNLRFGTSLSFCKKIDRETLRSLKAAGISSVELSFGYDYYMNVIDFTKNHLAYAEMAKEDNIELWSIHLPFSGYLDVSNTNGELRAITIYTHRVLIEAAGKAGIMTRFRRAFPSSCIAAQAWFLSPPMKHCSKSARIFPSFPISQADRLLRNTTSGWKSNEFTEKQAVHF